MKILVIAPTPFFADRGTHIRILEEARALEKRGHALTIATYHIGRDLETEIATKIKVRRIQRWLFWYKKLEAGPDWQKIILDLLLLRKVFYLARTEKPEVLHAHLHEGALIGWVVQKLVFWHKMRLVVDFHGSLTKEMESHSYLRGGILKKIFRKLEKVIDNLGDAAVASSWENAEEIRQLRQDKQVTVVLDGVGLENYANRPSKQELRQELELPQDKKIIVYGGALVPNKGTDYLFAAIRQVAISNPQTFFVLAGFPMESAERFVQENKITQQVRLVSPLNYFELPKLLLACDLGVDPKDSSTRQASGKILQYMAAGLPVACFERENNRNYLGTGAFYAGELSAAGLAKAFEEFLRAQPVIIAEKGQNNLLRVEKYSWDNAAVMLEQVYLAARQ